MKILFLNEVIPFPLDSGGKMRTWNFVKALATEHELSILCFERNNTPKALVELEKYFRNIWTVSKKHRVKESKLNNICNTFKSIPWQIGENYSKEFNKVFLKIISKNNLDIIFSRYISMGQYMIRNINKIHQTTIIDLDDIEFIKYSRIMKTTGNSNIYYKYRNLYNNYLLKNYYKKLKVVKSCIVCSQKDEWHMRKEQLASNISIIPNSINVNSYSDVDAFKKEDLERRVILFCSNLSYAPNIDGIKWFIKKVFPLIEASKPSVKLNIVGSNPSKDLYDYANEKSIFLYPNVSDVRSYYNSSSIVIVPIHAGGGTRVKILEAFSCRRPVVSTTIGAEGLNITNNEQCIMADTPNDFAKSCVKLLNNFMIGSSLVEEGCKLVKSKFDVDIVRKQIEKLFNYAKS